MQKFVSGDVVIENGVIYYKGKVVGKAVKDLKYGYHPSVKVVVYENEPVWFELDEEKLLEKIAKLVINHEIKNGGLGWIKK